MTRMLLGVLFGLKTHAWFDVWSMEHVLSGLSVGHAVRKSNHSHFQKKISINGHEISTIRFDIIGVLFIAFAWEAVEHYLEVGLAGESVEYWFQGVEFWGNRIIADPLLMVLGYFLAKKYPKFIIPARVLSVVWLFVHIFIFPHSMYLQEIFGS